MKLGVHGIGRYRPGAAIGPARWPHYDLIVVLAGSLTLASSSRITQLFAHDAVLIPPGASFRGTTGKEGSEIWVQHFSAEREEMPRPFPAGGRALVLHFAAGAEIVGALLRRLHYLSSPQRKGGRHLRAALLAALLEELNAAARHSNLPGEDTARLRLAVAWAEEHLEDIKSLGAVARQAGLSESHFRSLFRQWRAQPAGSWLRELRMTLARRLLLTSSLPSKAIGACVGFGDPVAFSRCFRRIHGMPPGQFRRGRLFPV
jgi:AraC-like DNA-binding protein